MSKTTERWVGETEMERKAIATYLSVKLMTTLITLGFPPSNETLLALRLVARLHELVPSDISELMNDEEKFVKQAKQELDFLFKDLQ